MNLRRPVIPANVHPEAGNAGNIRTLRIRVEAEHVGIELAGLLQFLGLGPDTNAVVMKFDDFDRHASQFTSPGTKHEILRMMIVFRTGSRLR